MSALEERRQRANETFWNHEPHGTMAAVDDAIQVATRVQMTHEIVLAFIQAPDTGADHDDIAGPLRAAFEAAGFEVVQ